MPSQVPFIDLVIVGGGALGTLLAARIEEIGLDLTVACFRLQDRPDPNAESLRNLGLFQSGLRYLQIDPVTSAIMRRYRPKLLELRADSPLPRRGLPRRIHRPVGGHNRTKSSSDQE